MDLQKNRIHLYSNQVFITDNVENIVPDFLTLLHGVIDSPDIPLNVSRSYLQEDANVKKISGHISKKVSDKLAQMFKKDREAFEAQWDDLRVFVEYGMLTDEKFAERAQKFFLYKDTAGKCHTHEELMALVGETQKDKHGKVILPYTPHAEGQHSYVKEATDRGYTVLVMDGPLAAHVVGKLEQTHSDVQFKRVDADIADKLIEKDEELSSALRREARGNLEAHLGGCLPGRIHVQGSVCRHVPHLGAFGHHPIRVHATHEGAAGRGRRRVPDVWRHARQLRGHRERQPPLASSLLSETDDSKRAALAKQAANLARLSQGLLEGEELTAFIQDGFAQLQGRLMGYAKWIGGAVGWALWWSDRRRHGLLAREDVLGRQPVDGRRQPGPARPAAGPHAQGILP